MAMPELSFEGYLWERCNKSFKSVQTIAMVANLKIVADEGS